jgi:hypothetical protein
MRAHAAVLVLALLVSPLGLTVCEVKCAPAAAPRPSADASCHDARREGRDRLQSPRHCSDRHPESVVAGVPSSALSVRDLQAVTVLAAAESPPVSTIQLLRRPTRARSIVRAAAASPPLRI